MPYGIGKKVIVINYKDKPIYVSEIKDISSHEYLVIEKECQENFIEFLNKHEEDKLALLERIAELEKEVKVLKGEE